jgi:hypothetical protein
MVVCTSIGPNVAKKFRCTGHSSGRDSWNSTSLHEDRRPRNPYPLSSNDRSGIASPSPVESLITELASLPWNYAPAMICSAMRSESAEIVRKGLTPRAPSEGCTRHKRDLEAAGQWL